MLEVKVPAVGESVTEVTLANWLVKDGDIVEIDQPLCEIDSDKATFEVTAEKSGRIAIVVQAGETVPVGAVIAKIDTSVAVPAKKEPVPAEPPADSTVKTEPKEVVKKTETKASQKPAEQKETAYAQGVPSPAAAKLIAEHNIKTSSITPSGKGGRITKEDVLKTMARQPEQGNGSEAPKKGSFSRETHREKMSTLRKTIARRLVAAKNETAMLTTFNEVDMSAILHIRNQYKEKFKEIHGIGLGFMSFFTKACCIALQEFPAVNGIIEDEYIVYHDYCDIGIAVSTPRGLVVPVIRNAESLSMAEIEKAVVDLATRGRDNKLTLEEMQGGTFTISNGGVFGSLLSTPILNAPQSAILGMHKIEERPIAVNGQVVIRPMMYVALSYDHRIIDGKESVSFLVRVKQLLENPAFMLTGDDPVKTLLGV
ncbi:MAG: dihydrolipoyllysine-residue succinyltransferase component of 2-oxoglutarate dehydrogenase complex [Chitinophagales bacterium]|nr:MAG: dihydrolipoyllysine-residue succinyltransferase component of 2-oxoglutarate dehydrogenase complex [Chitinophagales bacterium]